MENHFLIKFPDKLQSKIESQIQNNIYNFEIYTKNEEVIFNYNNKEYKTIFYDIPTVIEIQKTMDKTQFYKAGNVSNCLYVIDESEVLDDCITKEKSIDEPVKVSLTSTTSQDNSNEIEHLEKDLYSHKIPKTNMLQAKRFLELSGISPCLRYCKVKRFPKKPQVFMRSHEQELKVKQLLEKEKMASHTEIIFCGEDETSDVSSLAAEIEYNLDKEDKMAMQENVKNKRIALKELEEKIKGKEQQLETVTNLIIRKRFMDNLNALKSEFEMLLSEINDLESFDKKM